MDDDFEDDSLDDFSEQAAESFLQFFAARPVKNRRFRPIDVAVIGLFAAHNFAEAATNSLALAYNKLSSHANLGRDMEDMQEEAAREIETLISGEDQ